MTGLAPLLKKEVKEQLRTYKLLIVGGIFLLFGITTPLMLKYLPQIIELAGEQMNIQVPPPTAVQSLAEYASTIGQMGVLVAVLIAMGSVSNELRHGTAVMILSKPVSRAAFVSAKIIAMSLTFLVSLALASLFCFAYTVWLIGSADISAFVSLNLLIGLFLVLCLAVTTLFSSIFKSPLAAGGISIAVLIMQAALSALPLIGNYVPGKLLGWGSSLLSGRGDTYWQALAVTVATIGTCLYLAQRALRNKEI
ncbi:MAG: ABC transporter permease subunit [Chloroflexi bacterium]|nr:ABC transporter permease subunit [Chloroflexota bacterium]